MTPLTATALSSIVYSRGMRMRFGLLGLILQLILIGNASNGFSFEETWNKETEKSLRKLIATENVILQLYMSKGTVSFPLHRLQVPERFVEIYRINPTRCLTVLADIVETGTPHDALVAFQFGYAGDKPQIAIPLFAYVPKEDLDKPVGDDETYRQCCLRIIKKLLREQKEVTERVGAGAQR